MSLPLQDTLFTLLHLLIIGFNLLGWAIPALRKTHFWATMATLFCWLVLGFWHGIGYCPITDWHWQVKSKLGQTDLPNSFIKYFADRLFKINANAVFIDALTLGFFFTGHSNYCKAKFLWAKKIPHLRDLKTYSPDWASLSALISS